MVHDPYNHVWKIIASSALDSMKTFYSALGPQGFNKCKLAWAVFRFPMSEDQTVLWNGIWVYLKITVTENWRNLSSNKAPCISQDGLPHSCIMWLKRKAHLHEYKGAQRNYNIIKFGWTVLTDLLRKVCYTVSNAGYHLRQGCTGPLLKVLWSYHARARDSGH